MLNKYVEIVPETKEVVRGYTDFGIVTETIPYEEKQVNTKFAFEENLNAAICYAYEKSKNSSNN